MSCLLWLKITLFTVVKNIKACSFHSILLLHRHIWENTLMWKNIFSLSGNGQNVSKSQSGFEWRDTDGCVALIRCLVHSSTTYQMLGAAIPQKLTCIFHHTLLYLFLGRLWLSLRLASVFHSSLSLSLSGSPSWSSEEGIHVPVPRTSVGPCRTPALPPAPALSAWMSSYSAVWTALVSRFCCPKFALHHNQVI